jgi:hypothetical protein
MPYSAEQLRKIHTFKDLLHYLEEKLDWPLHEYQFDELTFEYQPEELGLKEEESAKVRSIHQLRPLQHGQPWGIFFVEFENKKLPVVVLRRILSHLVVKKRASANKASEAAWHAEDLMFITTFGEDDIAQREIAFAHFHQSAGDLPTLHVLGWDGGDTPLKLAHLDSVLQQHLRWPENTADHLAWRQQWASPFQYRIGYIISTASALAEALASLARGINNKAIRMLAAESENGPLRKLYKSFQTALIHDLTEESFADTYAQTITYGLLTAAISRTDWSEGRHGTFIIAENVADMVPITNPFLKEMLQYFLKVGGRKGGIDFDELGIQDVVELLRGKETNLPAILRDFGNRTPGEDPVIHFYEHFLSAYNKKLKIQRGVFYTPQPVVSYIIRSVHELLQTEFGLEDGLASTITWGEMIKRHPDMKLPILTPKNPSKPGSKDILISPESPFVMILDIATGTGTFLVEIIDVIHKTMKAKWQKQGKREQEIVTLWNEYVPKHLLPRLYGYELMMAPYAIAHMKIGLKLSETGYKFMSNERVRVYLTNTLEPASDSQQQLVGILPALAREAEAVNVVKRDVRFTVVVGNPPYAGHSSNTGDWITGLVKDYYIVDGKPLGERNPKWLQDDYVKFIRLGQQIIAQAEYGIQSYITNHGYIDNPTFRGMRQSLLTDFCELKVLDLHGNMKKKETTPAGEIDENVFDIQQGVAVFLAIRGMKKTHFMKQSDVFGTRSEKYSLLNNNSVKSIDWLEVNAVSPFYIFLPQDEDVRTEYLRCPSMKQIMPVNVLGFQTHRDGFAIAFDQETIISRCEALRDPHLKDEDIKTRFGLKDSGGWNVRRARKQIHDDKKWEDKVIRCLYRPFDVQWCYFSTVAMDRPRRELINHVVEKVNICLLIPRQISFPPWRHCSVSDMVAESCLISLKSKEGNYNFPLYLYPESGNLDLEGEKSVNFSDQFLSELASAINIQQDGPYGLPKGLSPEDIFHYIYGILHSPGYRNRYDEFLKSDFPRVPLTSNVELFHTLAKFGSELVALHLLESHKVNDFITRFTGKGDNSIPKKPTWKDNAVWINTTQRFEGVPENVWNFHIGGYQVCEKWLKDRKGRTLSADDITHYQRIVVALNETIRLMAEIDQVIDEHGGWPIK